MSNNNAVSTSGSGNQFSQILTSNIPPGLAAILLAYRLQRYGASLFPICQNPNLPCPVLSLNIPLSFHQSPLTKPLTKLGLRASLAVIDARKLLHALKAWIRANPKQLIAICVGFALFILGFGPHHSRCDGLWDYGSRMGEYCCGMAIKYRIRRCRQSLRFSTKCCYDRGCKGVILCDWSTRGGGSFRGWGKHGVCSTRSS